MQQATVLGIYRERGNAEDAINKLQTMGYNAKDISIVMRDKSEGEKLSQNTGADVAGGAVSGATTGAIVGGLAGLLASFVIPGLGAFFIGGPIAAAFGLTGTAAATVSGAATGAAAGGLIGALMGLGLPEEDAKRYQQHVEEGAILVAVPTQPQRSLEVERLFSDTQATDIKAVIMDTDITDSRSATREHTREEDQNAVEFQPDFQEEDTSKHESHTRHTGSHAHKTHADEKGAHVNPIQIQKYLSHVDYPAHKQDLVQSAKKHGADKNVLYTLEELPDEEFDGPTAVSRAIGKIE